jgi:hypothetical protein
MPTSVSSDAEQDDTDSTTKIGKDEPDQSLEWKLLAIVLDRILFLLFLAVSILVAVVMLNI